MSTIRLQYYGMAKAQKAEDFVIGDMMMWNFGAKSIVTGVESETQHFITFILDEGGKKYSRKMKRDRLVAIG